MDTAKSGKINIPQQIEDTGPSSKKGKNVYDVIHSEELDLLYKKNAHLLARLSKTGRENTLLYTKLSSLNREKSHLGDKNTVLSNKFMGLKGQISLFARQHRDFNYQAFQLKKELKKFKEMKVQGNFETKLLPETLIKQEKKIHLLRKKEQVYRKQIQTLQNLCQDKDTQKRNELKSMEKEQKIHMKSLEDKIQKFYRVLCEERNKTAKNQPTQMKKIKVVNQGLNKKFRELTKELKSANQSCHSALRESEKTARERDQLKSALTNQSKEMTEVGHRLEQLQKENKKLRKMETKWNQGAEKLKAEEQRLSQEGQKIKSYKVEIKNLKKNQEDFLHYKNQTLELKQEKEKLRSGFTEQLNLFSKERDYLKFQCESLKKALAVGKLGFDQAMLSFQRKYTRLYAERERLKKQIEEEAGRVQSLRAKMEQFAGQHIKEKEESENQIRRQKDKYIHEISGELKAFKERNQELECQIQKIKMESQNSFLRGKTQIQEEVRSLKLGKEREFLRMEEKHKTEIENLKSDHKTQLKNIESVFKGQLQHIRAEMENDLCSERKRHEIFKNMKTKQIQEMESALSVLQARDHELKTRKAVLEKSLEETKEHLDRHLRKSQRWEERNKSLKALWQDLQKQNETKDQQIKALQKLNRSLSLSLNQKKNEAGDKKNVFSNPAFPKGGEIKEKEKESLSHVLADIHFD